MITDQEIERGLAELDQLVSQGRDDEEIEKGLADVDRLTAGDEGATLRQMTRLMRQRPEDPNIHTLAGIVKAQFMSGLPLEADLVRKVEILHKRHCP